MPAARVPSLDGLRAIAVGLVFVSHLYNGNDAIAALGPIGVRIFFVISGFIITKLLLDERQATGRISLKAFYLRRTSRIFPACYAYIAFVAALSAAGIAKDLRASDVVFGLTYSTNYAPRVHWSLQHLWSLAVEEQFYLVWPFLFVSLSERWARRLLVAVLVLAPVSRALSYAYTADPTPVDHMFHTVADSLATGCLIGLSAAAWTRVDVYRMLPSSLIYAWMAILIAAASLYHQAYRGAYYWVGLTVLNLSIALFVLRLTEARDAVTRVLNSRLMTGLGLISYSLYLWQQPFLYPFAHPNPLQRFPVNVACAVLAALGSYFLVEKPFRRCGMRSRLGRGLQEVAHVSLLRSATAALHRLDHQLGRFSSRREVLVEMRTPVYHAVLGPIAEAVGASPDVRVWYTGESPERVRSLVPEGRFLTHAEVEWRRFDLYLNGDPWAAARLRRCARRVNFFHGVAGKYDLDQPSGLPMGFEDYDSVAFINRDRMRRYLDAGIVTPRQAALVGYPKLDRLASGGLDGAAIRASLGLRPGRATALYAPTYSEASSLHLAGEAIVRALAGAGFNVIVKLHDRSLDPDPKYTGGIDWRARFADVEQAAGPDRVRFIDTPDATPLLAAADCLVTDHSSVGFEYLVLDRPLLVFDAPDLARVARINPEKIELLRGAATVVRTPDELAAAAIHAIENPADRAEARRQVARHLFFDPGGATARAAHLIHRLLHPAAGIPVSAPEAAS